MGSPRKHVVTYATTPPKKIERQGRKVIIHHYGSQDLVRLRQSFLSLRCYRDQQRPSTRKSLRSWPMAHGGLAYLSMVAK